MPSAKAKKEPFQVPVYWLWIVLVVGELLLIGLFYYRQYLKWSVLEVPAIFQESPSQLSSQRAPLDIVDRTNVLGQRTVVGGQSSTRAPIPPLPTD